MLKSFSNSFYYFFHQVIVTLRAGHAHDIMVTTTNKELNSYDGVVAVVSGYGSSILCIFLINIISIAGYPSYSKFMILETLNDDSKITGF